MFDASFLLVHEPCFNQIQLPLKELFVAFERAGTENLIEFGLDFSISGVLTLNNWLFGEFRTLLLHHDIDLLNGSILKLLLYDGLSRSLWQDRLKLCVRDSVNRWLILLGLVPRMNSRQVLIQGIYSHRLLKMHLNWLHRLFELRYTLINQRIFVKIDLRLLGWEHLLLVIGHFIGLLHDNALSLFYDLPVRIWNYFLTFLCQYGIGHLLIFLIQAHLLFQQLISGVILVLCQLSI